MSAPDTNIPKQAKRHKPALTAISASLILVTILFVAYLTLLAMRGDAPEGAEAQIDGRVGEINTTE